MEPDHYQQFKEFCIKEIALNGPDPQLLTVAKMSEGVSDLEMMWRGGVAVGVWNVPTAYEIWNKFDFEAAFTIPRDLSDFIHTNWAGILTRRERRCVRTPDKLVKYLDDLANWIAFSVQKMDSYPNATYDDWWESVQEIKYMGRYIALKYLEFLRAFTGRSKLAVPDIRADGGWSPVKSLCMIRPVLSPWLVSNLSRKEKNAHIEKEAASLMGQLEIDGVEINFFQLQVMLCEYRTGYEHAHQYPGRSLDEELEYATKSSEYWKDSKMDSNPMFQARIAAFPSVALGEEHDWNGIRHELGTCIKEHGYFWTDLEYDYEATKDLANPVRRT